MWCISDVLLLLLSAAVTVEVLEEISVQFLKH
jgi:hypothetical protein